MKTIILLKIDHKQPGAKILISALRSSAWPDSAMTAGRKDARLAPPS
jgi:hypothetical protein